MIGPVAFLAPWLLLGLAALPVLWWLLRAVPPSPARRLFPGVRLLLGLQDPERMPERTPWWLLLLRMLALAAAILAFAGPVLNPRAEGGDGPLLVLLDGGWGDAPDWSGRMGRVSEALSDAGRSGRTVAVLSMAAEPPPEGELPLRAASDWSERLAGIAPQAWAPDRAAWAEWLGGLDAEFETLWLTDGIAHEGGAGDVARALLDRGPVTLVRPGATAVALTPARLEEGSLVVTALRAGSAGAREFGVSAIGPDPNGVERVLGTATGAFVDGADTAEVPVGMPVELRNRVARVALSDGRSAAGVVMADDSVRRRKVALMAGHARGEAQDLIDPLHYLRKALEPFAETIEAPLAGNAERRAGHAGDGGCRKPGRGGARGADGLDREGRRAGAVRGAASGAVRSGAAGGGPVAAGAAARGRALGRRRDVLGRAASASALRGGVGIRGAGGAGRRGHLGAGDGAARSRPAGAGDGDA